jgi:crotonobetainyl-CoA:carnitine CoA-transferase CaiB-like acyl-CoA transferase
MALVHRQRTGEGQELWTSLHDGGVIFTSDAWVGADGQPWDRPELDAGLHGLGPGYRLYRTQDEGWICIAAVTDGQWQALVEVVGRPELAGRRHDDRAAVEAELEAAFATRMALQWTRLLDDAGVPNELAVDSQDGAAALHDDDNVRLGLVAEYPHPVLGRLRQFGALFGFSATPIRIGGPPPLVGEHSRQILNEVGYRDGDVDALIAAGVVYAAAEPYGFAL